MAEVTVKLFGVLRIDTHLANEQVQADRLSDIFALLNDRAELIYKDRLAAKPGLRHPAPLSFSDAIVYINGDRCSKKRQQLKDGDEIWLLSPASGG
ncbi:MAG: MoaD/ThiS family protein [Lachnospiraceae bacterium]|nr:MoaD/ThiS family protein [Lachnospiraceae bacterium]